MDTNSEEHRAACEAREVAGWSVDRRNAFYPMVKAKRGQPAAQALADAVNAVRRNERPAHDGRAVRSADSTPA